LALASDDENSGFPFSNPEKSNPGNITDYICDILVGHPELLVSFQ
jgi:hypothetical protein